MLKHPAVFKGYLDLEAVTRLGEQLLRLGHDPGSDLAHSVIYGCILDLLFSEGVYGNITVNQCSCYVVLGAELALQLVVRVLIEHDHREVGLVHFSLGNVFIGEVVVTHQAKQAIQHGVVAAAAGILLNHESILGAEGLAHVVGHTV